MNHLSQKEFQDRVEAVARAMGIFGKITGGNITEAFTLYQKVLAEQDRQVWITTAVSGNRPRALFDLYERPRCPDCESDLLFRPVPENPEGVKTQLVCSNTQCNVVLDSELTLEEWEKELRNGPKQVEEADQEGPHTGDQISVDQPSVP